MSKPLNQNRGRFGLSQPIKFVKSIRSLGMLLQVMVIAAPLIAAPSLIDRLKDEHARGQKQWIYNDFHTVAPLTWAGSPGRTSGVAMKR